LRAHLTGSSAKLVALAGVAVLIGASAAAGALVLTQEEDRSPAAATQLLEEAARSAQLTAARLERADNLAAIRLVGQDADQRSREVVALLDHAEHQLAAKPALAEPVQRVLTSEAAALDSLAELATLTPRRLNRWDSMVANVRRTAAELSVQHRALHAPPLLTRPEDPGQSLRTAANAADVVVRRGRRLLAGWRRRYRSAQRERRHDLAVLDAYHSTMSSYLDTYDGLREEMSTAHAHTFGRCVRKEVVALVERHAAAIDLPDPRSRCRGRGGRRGI
jgi:hypothetical protein